MYPLSPRCITLSPRCSPLFPRCIPIALDMYVFYWLKNSSRMIIKTSNIYKYNYNKIITNAHKNLKFFQPSLIAELISVKPWSLQNILMYNCATNVYHRLEDTLQYHAAQFEPRFHIDTVFDHGGFSPTALFLFLIDGRITSLSWRLFSNRWQRHRY